jgi:hypothetical protein
MERRNNFMCVLLFQLIFNKNMCFITCRIPVPRDLRFIAVQRYGYGIYIVKQGRNVFLIVTIFRPVIVATPVNSGIYEPVSQAGKINKSWEVIPQNERALKIQEKEILREINGSSNES